MWILQIWKASFTNVGGVLLNEENAQCVECINDKIINVFQLWVMMQYITHKFEYSKEKPNTLTADGKILLSCVLKLLEGC